MNQKILKAIVVLLLIMTMTMANFILLGFTAVTYAAGSVSKDNCTFSTYFIDSQGNKTNQLTTNMQDENVKLGIDIGISDQGYFNGEIQINNSNFKLNTEIHNEHINSITENNIKLNQLNAGDQVSLEIGITPNKDDEYDLSNLSKETEVKLTGTYVAGNNQSFTINNPQKVTLNLNSPYLSTDSDKLNLSVDNITNKVYSINSENKRLLQLQIGSGMQDNAFPVNKTEFTLDVPKDAEDVKVSSRGTNATGAGSNVEQNWDKENNKLTVDITNNASSDNKVRWTKSGNDTIIVTYVLPENADVSGTLINLTDSIELYDLAKTTITKTSTLSNMEEKDGVVSYDLVATNELYKGNLYYGEDTNYQETATIDIKYPQIATEIELSQGSSTYLNVNKSANAKYVSTSVNKQDLINILGDNGVLNIKDANKNTLASISKDYAETQDGDSVTLTYPEQNNIIIDIADAENEGKLAILNNKKISAETYSKEEMKTFTGLQTNGTLTADENVGTIQKMTQTVLTEPSTYATITSNTTEFSTLQTNENVNFNVILKTDDIKYDLYKNPSVEIVFPKEMSVVNATAKPVYIDGFTITENNVIQNAEGNNVLVVKLAGEQKTHSNNVSEGIILNVNAEIGIDKTISTRDSEIVLHYTNENAGVNVYEQKLPIKIVSKDGLLYYDRTEGFNAEGDVIESISDENLQGNLDLTQDPRTVTDNILLVNNYDTALTNVSFVLQNDGETIPVAEPVIVTGADATISYTQDGANWTQDLSTITNAKAYKVDIANFDAGACAQIQSKLGISNFDFTKSAVINKKVDYTLNGQKLSQAKELELKSKEQPLNNVENNTQTDNSESVENGENAENSDENPSVSGNAIDEENAQKEPQESSKPDLSAKVETSVGTKTLTANDSVFGGEIIQNTITLTNTSKVDVKNVKVSVTQENANMYELVEIPIINPVVAPMDETITQHNYDDVDTNERTFDTIDTIKPGETKTLTYEARVNQVVDDSKSTYGTVKIDADDLEEKTQKTQENKIKNGKVKLTLKNSLNEELEKSDTDSVCTELHVVNTTNDTQNNVKVEIQLPEIYYIDNVETDVKSYRKEKAKLNDLEDGVITDLAYNKEARIITFNITKLEKDEDITTVLYPIAEMKNKENDYEIADVSANVLVGNDTYYSNIIHRKIYSIYQDIQVDYSIKDQKEKYETGDEITFVMQVQNKSKELAVVNMYSELEENFKIAKATVNNDGEERDASDSIADNYVSIINEKLDAGKTVNIEVTATVSYDGDDDKKVTNSANYSIATSGENDNKEVSVVLKGKNSEDTKDDDKDDDGKDDDSKDDNKDDDNNDADRDDSEDTTDDTKDDNKNDDINNRVISGYVWNDRNKNGIKDDTETGMGDVEVRLVKEDGTFLKDSSNNVVSQKTLTDGSYKFDVPQGKYIVVFLYDSQKYMATEYKASGSAENKNSDAISKDMNVDGNNKTVAVTDLIDNTSNDVNNVNLGLYEKSKFDLKLDKYITKVSVQSTSGTKQYEFGRESLSKVEIRAKEFVGATVAVEYQIQVTNEGDVDGFVNDIIDYMPEGFKFDSNLNKSWYMGTDKNLHNTSLENEQIKAGQTKTVTLVLIKTMTSAEGQTLPNTAEIFKASNKDNVNDNDSVPGNKKTGEDDIGTATLLVTISTGIGRIITISALIVAIITLVIILILWKGGKKIEEDE